jgi:3-methyladenine DNA glycosylase AlkD
MTDSKVNQLQAKLLSFIEKIVDPRKVELDRRWHKEPNISYGFSTSDYVKVYKEFNPHFHDLNLRERIELARNLIKSENSTITHLGIHLLRISRQELGKAHFGLLDETLDNVTEWGNTDLFCGDVMQPILERMPDQVIKLLRRWNQSENKWKRRASVVTFTRKTAKNGEFIDVALELCNNLIWDREDLVRKGVGWALKDNMRFDKKRVLEYVKGLRRKGVSSTITLYAIHDLTGEERRKVLRIKPPKKRT